MKQRLLMICKPQATNTCGAVPRTKTVAMTVKAVKNIKQSLSSTIAANLQSASTAADSSSSRSFSVIT